MSNSTTRLVLTVVISLGIMLVWFKYFSPQPQKQKPRQAQSKTGNKTDGNKKADGKPVTTKSDKTSKASASQPASQPAGQPTAKHDGPRSLTKEGIHTSFDWKAGNATLTFTSNAGALRHATLKNPRYKEIKNGKLVPIDLVQTEAKKGPWPLVAAFPDSDFIVPENARYTLVKRDGEMLHYRWESKKVRIDKIYRLDKKLTAGTLTVKVKNLSKATLDQRLEMKLYARQDPKTSKPGFTNPYPRIPTGICHVNGEIHRRSVDAINGSQSGCTPAGCGMGSGAVEQVGEINWVASDDLYFMVALIPVKQSQGLCRMKLRPNQPNVVEVSLLFKQTKMRPGQTVEHTFALFLGSKDLEQLDALETKQKRELGLSDSIQFGSFAIICRPMLAMLKFFYSFLGNWGLAIILLTLIVKLLTFWPTHKSMKSMRQMQKLKPEMDKLREKYKDDKARLNQETMALYRQHKVNPLGGCLPMLLQMPIWFAL
jgi:YidC/Oxa1 family membrane protein insertase